MVVVYLNVLFRPRVVWLFGGSVDSAEVDEEFDNKFTGSRDVNDGVEGGGGGNVELFVESYF